jgi:hypothetical protein
MKYRKEKSIVDLKPEEIIHLGRNDYYYDENHILTMTMESPDSYWTWSHPKTKIRKETGREVWVRINGEVPKGKVVARKDLDDDSVDVDNLYLTTKSELRIRMTKEGHYAQ